jgi:hypothetical protein
MYIPTERSVRPIRYPNYLPPISPDVLGIWHDCFGYLHEVMSWGPLFLLKGIVHEPRLCCRQTSTQEMIKHGISKTFGR